MEYPRCPSSGAESKITNYFVVGFFFKLFYIKLLLTINFIEKLYIMRDLQQFWFTNTYK